MTNEEFYLNCLKKARRPNDQILLAVLEDEWRQILQSLENSPFHPWFLEKLPDASFTTNTFTTAMPSDFLLLVEDTQVVAILDGERFPLDRRYHEDMDREYDSENIATPEVYDIFAGQLYLFPIPDDTYLISMKYYQKSSVVPVTNQDEVTNLWILNAEEYVTTLIAQRLCDFYTSDEKRADSLAARAKEIRSEMWKFNEAKKHQDMNYTIDR